MTLRPPEGFTTGAHCRYAVLVAQQAQTATKLEYLIELVVRRTINEHGGDVAAATDALRRMSPFMNDDATRALMCEALDNHRA